MPTAITDTTNMSDMNEEEEEGGTPMEVMLQVERAAWDDRAAQQHKAENIRGDWVRADNEASRQGEANDGVAVLGNEEEEQALMGIRTPPPGPRATGRTQSITPLM